ncbi:hypothetical protein IMF27_17225 [Pseudomonas sp. PCH199]|uniref:glycosyl hydrolase family 28-related protein n=1 Tax=unclassified Pseudomonas TaxID=196821 RepID=UPI000BD71560|nr:MULTISPECIES: glycosyl hydrolase family 28-related protein [unclassified Pseudomonas]MCW8277191.1 hypothetical protein [Pseudomonas sp. PCH199]PAM82673.1 hypothetical protein CES87_17565 [Pseudomonas sp. ERMR1:02]
MVNRRNLLKLSALGTASFAAPLAYSASKITMAYNTGNPPGSSSPKDLIDNAEDFDFLLTGAGVSHPNRLGVPLKSWKGMEAEFDADQAERVAEFDDSQDLREVQFNTYLDSTGFENPPLNYVDGTPLQVDRATQLVVRDGNLYTVKRPASFPHTLTGTWGADQTHLVLRSDQTVRQDLADPLTGPEMLGFRQLSTNASSRTVADRLRETVSVKDFGVKGDGITDDTAAIQAALDSITNGFLTTQQRYGGISLFFSEGIYLISKPLVIKSVNTTLTGAGAGATIIQATSGTFSADTGSALMGKWMIIWEAAYVLSGDDLYNCHVFDMSLDFNNRNDVKGIWIGGGRNSSSIERVQFIRYYTHLIELGKSARDFHSITQGFLVSNCLAIWDGNVGQHTADRDGLLFVISAGNENTFFNVDAASGSGETSIGTAFIVGNGSYQCGGNKFIACGVANLKAAHVIASTVSGFVVGETVTTGDGFKGVITSIAGLTLKMTVPVGGGSAYVPRTADSIVGGTSGATATITSAVFGKAWHLSNSWGTVIESVKAIESTACGVFMDNSDASKCTQNVVRGGRFFGFTASCFVAFGRSQFNRCEADVYSSSVSVLSGAKFATAQFYTVGSANASLVKFVSTEPSNSAIEYLSIGGLNVRNSANTAIFAGKNATGGVRVDNFRTDLFDANQVRLLDREGNVRVSTENGDNGKLTLHDGTGAARVIVAYDGSITVNSASGKTVAIQQNGASKIVIDAAGLIRFFGLTTAVPAATEAVYKDASGFVKVTPP